MTVEDPDSTSISLTETLTLPSIVGRGVFDVGGVSVLDNVC